MHLKKIFKNEAKAMYVVMGHNHDDYVKAAPELRNKPLGPAEFKYRASLKVNPGDDVVVSWNDAHVEVYPLADLFQDLLEFAGDYGEYIDSLDDYIGATPEKGMAYSFCTVKPDMSGITYIAEDELREKAQKYYDEVMGDSESFKKRGHKSGAKSEGLESFIDEVATMAADLPKKDWTSYEKLKDVFVPKYQDVIPYDTIISAIVSALDV